MSRFELTNHHHEKTIPQRQRQAVGAVAVKNATEKIRRAGEDILVRRLLRSQGFEVRHLTEPDDIRKALILEQQIWHEKNYGDLADYEKYLPQSRVFAAFDGDKCIGMNRLFAGTPQVPPFLTEMPIDDSAIKQKLIEGGRNYEVEEFGTIGVIRELRGNSRVFLDICRLNYRDATARGIQTWGIIMEPERVRTWNDRLGFTFRQIGPAVDYQGGDCAAHVMDFGEVRRRMSSTKPELYDWFVNQPL